MSQRVHVHNIVYVHNVVYVTMGVLCDRAKASTMTVHTELCDYYS